MAYTVIPLRQLKAGEGSAFPMRQYGIIKMVDIEPILKMEGYHELYGGG
jgi:hypothetical protein